MKDDLKRVQYIWRHDKLAADDIVPVVRMCAKSVYSHNEEDDDDE